MKNNSPQDIQYLSKEKYDELSSELETLKSVERKEVSHELEYAKSLGDLKENAEYHQALERQGKIEGRIAALEAILKNAQIIKSRHTTSVEAGSVVVIQKVGFHDKQRFEIVGSAEADISKGKLSLNSPIGKAMRGKKKDDIFEVEIGKGKTKYKILKLE